MARSDSCPPFESPVDTLWTASSLPCFCLSASPVPAQLHCVLHHHSAAPIAAPMLALSPPPGFGGGPLVGGGPVGHVNPVGHANHAIRAAAAAAAAAAAISRETAPPVPDSYAICPGTLLHLLANTVVLAHTTPYLPPSALVSLASTGRAYRALLLSTPSLFRRLDLADGGPAVLQIGVDDRVGTSWRRAQLGEAWSSAQLDDDLTEDEFYSGPLRGVFTALGRAGWLAGIHTLVLDRVAVTAELIHEIITSPNYNVRILSLRDARHLNEHLLCRALRLACRPSRPPGMPRLRGLYIFGEPSEASDAPSKEDPAADTVGHRWYRRRSRILPGSTDLPRAVEWANTLLDCHGLLAFDGVLCNGPRHANSPVFGSVPCCTGAPGSGSSGSSSGTSSRPAASVAPALAAHALGGCAGCGAAPEGWTVWGGEAERADSAGYVSRYPLLWPPPRLSSSLRVAMCPDGAPVHPLRQATVSTDQPSARFIARCDACVRDRLCFTCRRWWCEACLPQVGATAAQPPAVLYSCRECGPSCHECVTETQLRCRRCRSGYCTVHNVGSSRTHCDCLSSSSVSPIGLLTSQGAVRHHTAMCSNRACPSRATISRGISDRASVFPFFHSSRASVRFGFVSSLRFFSWLFSSRGPCATPRRQRAAFCSLPSLLGLFLFRPWRLQTIQLSSVPLCWTKISRACGGMCP